MAINRRELFRSAAIVGASSLLPRLASAEPEASDNGSQIRLGIASYTFRNFDSAHLIDFMKQLRTPYLNLKYMHLPMKSAEEVKQQAAIYRAAGLMLTAAGNISFPQDDDDDLRAKFEYCKAAEVPIIVGTPTHKTLPRVEKFVKEYNIRLAIHNHGPQEEFPSPLDVLAAIQGMDARVGCCIDVGHTMRAGTDVVEAIHKAGPRLFDIHMKDLAKADMKDSQVAVGEGIMPVRAIFRALEEIRYAGNVDLEYEIHPEDPMPGVVESFAYMRGVIAGMA